MNRSPITLELAQRRHRLIALAITLIALSLAGLVAGLSLEIQALLLGAGVLLTGVPHGAVDHLRVAPRLYSLLGRLWLPAFALAYVALALLVGMLWWLAPTASLLGFLLLSVRHFGAGDANEGLGIVLHGSLPIVMPTIAYPAQVAALFALLTGSEATTWSDSLRAAQMPLALAWIGLTVMFLITRRRGPLGEVVEVAAIAALGCSLPPLISFGIYFCVWHAPRHILRVAQELRPGPWPRSLVGFWRSALPMSFATFVAAVAMVMLLPRESDPMQRWLQIVFVGLAALTVPHLVTTEALQRAPA
jgi:beta-carotene 15,15'-dioxygenase